MEVHRLSKSQSHYWDSHFILADRYTFLTDGLGADNLGCELLSTITLHVDISISSLHNYKEKMNTQTVIPCHSSHTDGGICQFNVGQVPKHKILAMTILWITKAEYRITSNNKSWFWEQDDVEELRCVIHFIWLCKSKFIHKMPWLAIVAQEISDQIITEAIITWLGGYGRCISTAGRFQISEHIIQVGRGNPLLGGKAIPSLIIDHWLLYWVILSITSHYHCLVMCWSCYITILKHSFLLYI